MSYFIGLALVAALAALVAGWIAAERHFDEYGVYCGQPEPRETPDDLTALAEEIRETAHVELPCGGCLTESREAASELRSRYGRREMLRRCLVVVASPELPDPHPAVVLADEILDRDGDARLLGEAIARRAAWLAAPEPGGAAPLARLEALIARLCRRLEQPLPPGWGESA